MSIAVIAGFEEAAAVCEPIQQCGCHLGIPEDQGSFGEAEVRGDDHAGALVKFAAFLLKFSRVAPPPDHSR